MNRIDFIELLQSLFPEYVVYNIGQHYKKSLVPYLVVRTAAQQPEFFGSRRGAYQIFDILIYVPDTSVVILDTITEDVYERLRRSVPFQRYCHFTGTVTADYHDFDIKMYMRSINVEVPREWY